MWSRHTLTSSSLKIKTLEYRLKMSKTKNYELQPSFELLSSEHNFEDLSEFGDDIASLMEQVNISSTESSVKDECRKKMVFECTKDEDSDCSWRGGAEGCRAVEDEAEEQSNFSIVHALMLPLVSNMPEPSLPQGNSKDSNDKTMEEKLSSNLAHMSVSKKSRSSKGRKSRSIEDDLSADLDNMSISKQGRSGRSSKGRSSTYAPKYVANENPKKRSKAKKSRSRTSRSAPTGSSRKSRSSRKSPSSRKSRSRK